MNASSRDVTLTSQETLSPSEGMVNKCLQPLVLCHIWNESLN